MEGIASLKKDMHVRVTVAVRSKRPPVQYTKGWRFELMVNDATGAMPLKFWGGPDEQRVRDIYNSITEGNVIEAETRVNEFNNALELSMGENSSLRVLDEGEYDPAEFLPKTPKDVEALWKDVERMMASVKDPTISKVLKDIYTPGFIAAFKKAPAAMHMHHATIGGLLDHTHTVATLCEQAIKAYPSLDRDLLLAGALLHDVAKMEEFVATTTIRTTPEAMLVGHIVIGSARLLSYRGKEGIDENTLLKLTHMIVSHHGSKELGSPKTPAFPEAILLAAMDQMDCAMVRTLQHIAAADKKGFDTYDPKEERPIYTK